MDLWYGTHEGDPCIMRGREAWVFVDKWKPLNLADAETFAKGLSKEQFERMFPDLPPLPPPTAAAAIPRFRQP